MYLGIYLDTTEGGELSQVEAGVQRAGQPTARPPARWGQPQVFRSGDDPWEVLVLMEWDELERARQFAASDSLKEAMQNAGVTDDPTFTFLQEV